MESSWEDDDEDSLGWPEDWASPEYHLNKAFLNEPEKSIEEIIEEFLRTL